jgi:hypothetical protein
MNAVAVPIVPISCPMQSRCHAADFFGNDVPWPFHRDHIGNAGRSALPILLIFSSTLYFL